MSPVNDSFMSGSLDHTVRIWDLRVNACQVWLLYCTIPSSSLSETELTDLYKFKTRKYEMD